MRRINYKSDFTLTETFVNEDGTPVSRPACDFTITYYTNKSTTFIASVVGGVCTHCSLDPDGSSVVVAFDDHGLARGVLHRTLVMNYPDAAMPSGLMNITIPLNTDVELWNGVSEPPYSVESQLLAPYVKGDSAYDIAVQNGFRGTAAEWIATMNGADGESAYAVAVRNGYVGTETQWLASIKGSDGDSAYEVAVRNGFVGTEEQWLAYLEAQLTYSELNETSSSDIVINLDSKLPNTKSSYVLTVTEGHTATFSSTKPIKYQIGIPSSVTDNTQTIVYACSLILGTIYINASLYQ